MFGNYNKAPLILGSTDDEGTYLVGGALLKPKDPELWSMIQQTPAGLQVSDLINTSYAEFKAATEEPNFMRFAWSPENKTSREQLREEMNDYFKGFFWKGDPNAALKKIDQRWDHSIEFK